ncbi:MAG: hypothetical protein J5726_06460 [Treponema sp.]|nr:hypothetical protein [Treponema sp.]
MTKEELAKIKDKTVGKRVLDILYNGFKALFEKEFGTDNELIMFTKRSAWDDPELLSWTIDAYRDEKFIPPQNLCEVCFDLTEYAVGMICMGFDFNENIKIVKQALNIKQFPVNKRVVEFDYLCKALNCDYEIFFNTVNLKGKMKKEIYAMGKGIFRLLEINDDARKLELHVNFDSDFNKYMNTVVFNVFFRDSEDFLECLKQFTDNCRNKKLTTIKQIKKELNGLPLQEYRTTRKAKEDEIENKSKHRLFN